MEIGLKAIAHTIAVQKSWVARWPLAITGALTMATAIGWAPTLNRPPEMLVNTTPSEPLGVYLYAPQPVQKGRIVAFRAPPSALPYIDRALPSLRTRPLLKAVAAGPGDEVCTTSGVLVINGQRLAPIIDHDRAGRMLPHWLGCRRLAPNELFVFSSRVPNSFDSRYYGPVRMTDVLGVYVLIATMSGEGA
jgi:conjugative transfer signal peptidase TraF